jgi:FlaA1/EpsC-like NDP-sugar epimerase/lipopolysaccharide/colanic/teichoic acid biosynthesis glycosyltransferase
MSLAKRSVDLLLGTIGLLLVSPIMAVVAILVKLEDGDAVFFRHERVGLRGSRFHVWKFRTMSNGVHGGSSVTVAGDRRITAIGRWLRAFKLDELPQLFNVLAGEMSFVGPRPEVPEVVAKYTPAQRRVLDFIPGITDPASLRFWNEGKMLAKAPDPVQAYSTRLVPDKIRLQLEYAERATVLSDLALMVETVRVVTLRAAGAVLDSLVQYRRPIILAIHIALVVVGVVLAFSLRFDFTLGPAEWRQLWLAIGLLLVIRLPLYRLFGLFRGYWEHVGLEDFVDLCKAATVGSVVFLGVLWLGGWIPGFPRSVLLLEWAAAIYLNGGVRLVARYLREVQAPSRPVRSRRTLIVGAGRKAESLLREIRRDLNQSLAVVGLVADGASTKGTAIHGVAVVGTTHDLRVLVERHRAEFIVIALDQPEPEEVHRVVSLCAGAGVEVKTLPSLGELLEGSARIDQLRSVQIEDLLGREPVRLQLTAVEPDIVERVVMITGGAGSIGSELARLLARCRPARLVLVDQAESPLYFLALEIAASNPALSVIPAVCDVTDESTLAQLFADHQPHYVIHAAAYKHVPMMESSVIEAVRNNVLGTLVLAQAAATWGCERFVLISTDKAVKPSSIMGASKRIAERCVLGLPSLRRSTTDFRAVRFGNVLASAGSVVPLFERQIANGGPLTVTHPEVERYFMTITEAAELVLQSGTLPEVAGRIAMLDMGQPVRILELAEKLIRLAGREPYSEVPIVFTGLRPGEKLREELLSDSEATEPTASEKIRVVCSQELHSDQLYQGVTQLVHAIRRVDEQAVLNIIRLLVPECVAPLRARVSGPVQPEQRAGRSTAVGAW